MKSNILRTPSDINDFVWAGKATFTLKNTATGSRYTFKVTKKKNLSSNKPLWFVGVMTGSDNEFSYSFLGTQFSLDFKDYKHGKKSDLAYNCKQEIVWKWFIKNLNNLRSFPMVEFWHEGRCGKCGRKLTVPESIEHGIGPECSKHLG